jgi:hypothetical protein
VNLVEQPSIRFNGNVKLLPFDSIFAPGASDDVAGVFVEASELPKLLF